jgi:hypothetical protein
MMLRRSPLRWLVLAGIMFFVGGLLLDMSLSKKGTMHLVLGMPVHQFRNTGQPKESNTVPEPLAFKVQLDSLHISGYTPTYELQVRKVDQEFSQEMHTSILPPSILVEAFPFSPMKILKIPDTEYRFRLKQFYPDFSFQYSYPENQDTIPPRAPGITLNLVTSGKEEVVTLRSDKPNLRKLDDVVGFGCVLEFYWTLSIDSLERITPDTGKNNNKIVFVGKDKKVFFFLNGKTDSLSLENNHFYTIPGKDSLGFTVLQSFPDARLLKAVPVSKSDKPINPVAEVEVWKLGGGAQNVYLYPNAGGHHGGEWRVPDSDLVLTCSLSHEAIVKVCQCSISIMDSLRQANTNRILNGFQVFSYGGKKFRLAECDVAGIWVNLEIWTAPGYYFKITGLSMALAAMMGILLQRFKRKAIRSPMIKRNEEDQ